MNHQTEIEWTHFPGYTGAAWNPYVGCSRVSPGCQNCYAERQAWRIVVQARAQGRPSPYEGTVDVIGGELCQDCSGIGEFPRAQNEAIQWCGTCWGFGRIDGEPRWTGAIHENGRLDLPLCTRKPRAFFVNSMSDLFHERLADQWILDVFGVAAASPQHLFVILTKRIERASRLLSQSEFRGGARREAAFWAIDDRGRARPRGGIERDVGGAIAWPLHNVLIGPSVEDQQRADERMPHAMALAKAGWRVVVSYEPALGPVDWRPWLTGAKCPGCECDRWGETPIAWLLVGAESGRGRRTFDPAWIPAAECADAGEPLFVKQGSAHKPGQQGNIPDDLWAIKQFPVVAP